MIRKSHTSSTASPGSRRSISKRPFRSPQIEEGIIPLPKLPIFFVDTNSRAVPRVSHDYIPWCLWAFLQGLSWGFLRESGVRGWMVKDLDGLRGGYGIVEVDERGYLLKSWSDGLTVWRLVLNNVYHFIKEADMNVSTRSRYALYLCCFIKKECRVQYLENRRKEKYLCASEGDWISL